MTYSITDKVDEESIIRQVEKICTSPEFRSKQLLCDFLSYIVSEYLAGRSNQLKGYAIGVDVFGRGEDFDPGEDALVRIHAGRLRRMLDLYYYKSGNNDLVHIEVPKGTYTPVITLHRPERATPKNKKKANRQRSLLEPGVILLPFKNLTGKTELDYFAQGFSAELSLEFTKFEDLIVYDYTTCMNNKEENLVPIKKWRKKGVRFVVDGSIMEVKEKVKVLVKLVDIVKENQVWAERYARELTADNLNNVQESIAQEVAQVIGYEYGVIFQRLSRDAKRSRPKNMDTYTAMLRYYDFLALQSPDSAYRAFNSLEQALREEPESAIAMALLSALLGNFYMLDQVNAEDAYDQMAELAEKAARIDPNSSTVKACLVYKCFVYNEKERFFDLVNRYLSMVQNNSAKVGTVAFHLALYGGWERAKLLLDRCMLTYQVYPKIFHGATALYYYRKMEYEPALVEANKYNLPRMFWGPLLRIAIKGQLGKQTEAAADIELLNELKPNFKEKSSILISRYIKENTLVDHVLAGLNKAGLATQ